MFEETNRFRQACDWFVNQKWFDNVILFFIALNCITLAMERPNIPPSCAERVFLASANYVFTVVFAIEMFVKVVSSGMFYGTDAYFTSGWNIMDGSLVIISIIDLLMSVISESSPRIFGILRVFRLLRSLRPLRVINRAPGLKLVVQTLLSSLRPIGNIVLICCTFFIIFGILGVQVLILCISLITVFIKHLIASKSSLKAHSFSAKVKTSKGLKIKRNARISMEMYGLTGSIILTIWAKL